MEPFTNYNDKPTFCFFSHACTFVYVWLLGFGAYLNIDSNDNKTKEYLICTTKHTAKQYTCIISGIFALTGDDMDNH